MKVWLENTKRDVEEQSSDTHKESSQLGTQPKGLDGCYGHQVQIVILVEVQRMGGKEE